MDTIQLLGCGYAHPATHVSNHELEKTIDTSDEWIVQRTGIHADVHGISFNKTGYKITIAGSYYERRLDSYGIARNDKNAFRICKNDKYGWSN